MKKLIEKSNSLLKYYLTFMGSAVLLGIIFLIFFGFNAGVDFGKVYEVKVYSFDSTQNTTYINSAKEVLGTYGYKATECFIEEHTESDAVVVRYKSNSANNAIKIQADLTAKLSLDEDLVEVEPLSISSATRDALKLLIAFGVVAVILFVYTYIRYDWKSAVVLISAIASGVVLPLAIMLFTRIELSIASLSLVILSATILGALYMALYSKIKTIERTQSRPKKFMENYTEYIYGIKFRAIIPTAIILLVFTCLIFTFQRGLVQLGLAGLILILIDAFVLTIFAPALQIKLNKEKN